MRSSLTARVVLLCCILLAATVAVAPLASAKPSRAYCKKHKHSKKCKKNPASGSVGSAGQTETIGDSTSPGDLVSRPTVRPGGPLLVDSVYTAHISGTLRTISFYADRTGTLQFFLLTAHTAFNRLVAPDVCACAGYSKFGATVKATTGNITVTKTGLQTYTVPTPWNVAVGDSLAMWQGSNGPLGVGGQGANHSVAAPTPPGVGATMTMLTDAAHYSFGATVTG